MNTESFFEKAWDEIKTIFGKGQSLERDIASFANLMADEIKNGKYTSLIEGTIATTATAINPALGALVSGLELALPKILNAITGVTSETPAQQANDIASYLENLKGISGTGYASLIGTINAVIQEYATKNTGTIVVDPSKLITSAQVIHKIE